MANQSFMKRNIVAIVMIPSILGIHFGWSLIQNNKTLVSPSEKMELPVVKFGRFLLAKVTGSEEVAGEPSTTKGTK